MVARMRPERAQRRSVEALTPSRRAATLAPGAELERTERSRDGGLGFGSEPLSEPDGGFFLGLPLAVSRFPLRFFSSREDFFLLLAATAFFCLRLATAI